MFERKVMLVDVVYRNHRVVSMSHDMVADVTIIYCDHWNNDSNTFMTSHTHTFAPGLSFEDAEEYLKGLDEYTALPDDEAELIDALETIETISDILTDEQAQQVPQVFPEWTVDIYYAFGKRVRYNDKLYRCEQGHTSEEGWEPGTATALWTRIAAEGEILDWVAPTGSQDAYNKGDKVRYNGKIWISVYDGANVWAPDVYGWEEVTE